MSAGRILTLGLGTPFSSVKFLVTLGYGTSATPTQTGDTHDGWWRKRKSGETDRARKFREENEQRRSDLLRAFARVTGIDLSPQVATEEVIQAVEQKIVKPKKPRERELTKMAANMREFLQSMAAFEREEIEREAEEEDFIVMSLIGRTLH